ncbi:hypothetical protein J2Z48_000043 [Croceifilum oryzae]|uniref:DUF4309 domain-containing protein n=1 Tax=Croceifilum oryzae TaxID=1553429 RepID=A0AAJ1WQV8_9BACL|nr:DUF4309 domain-containing protein [Croceifilum oryzae]MDQ0415885.1 hypothetical protein [Croceifilum oryzae]
MNLKKRWLYLIFLASAFAFAGCDIGTAPSENQIKVIDSPVDESSTSIQTVKEIIQLARMGKVINSEFSIRTEKATIIQKWGQPVTDPNYPDVLFYTKREIEFSVNDQKKVVRITCDDHRLEQIPLTDVIQTMGNPIDEYTEDGKHVLYYQTGNYQIYFGFEVPDKTDSNNPRMTYYYIVPMYDINTQTDLATTILRSAKKGTLPYLPKDLGIGTSKKLLFELWGEPKDGSSDPFLMYEEKYHTDISLDSFDKVAEITSYRPDYKKLKIDQVMKEIGRPTEIADTSKDVPHTADAIYTIKDQFGQENHLIFSHNTKTKQMIYVRLYHKSETD